MDSSSRREFNLDSRTVWVEQQLVNNVLLPKDNLPLGPGEYKAKLPERHISTPVIGKFRGPADHFQSFRSELQITIPSNNSNNKTYQPYAADCRSPARKNTSTDKTDFMTIFHDHDTRQPLDPSKRFCETPGSYLAQDPILRSVSHNGVQTATNVHFGATSSNRCSYKVALPEYEVKYDSPQLRPATKLGSFGRNKRVTELGTRSYYDEGPRQSPIRSLHQHSPVRSPDAGAACESPGFKSVYEMRCSLVPLPKLKTRTPEKLIFIDSSYRTSKTKETMDLAPSKIDKAASVRVFDRIVAIPRKHVSAGYSKNATPSLRYEE